MVDTIGNDPKSAIESLRAALQKGFPLRELEAEPEFAPLLLAPDDQNMLKEFRGKPPSRRLMTSVRTGPCSEEELVERRILIRNFEVFLPGESPGYKISRLPWRHRQFAASTRYRPKPAGVDTLETADRCCLERRA